MGYGIYWWGQLLATPRLTSAQRKRLSTWLDLENHHLGKITDAELDKRINQAGFKYEIAWNPVDVIDNDGELIYFNTENGYPKVIALIVKRLMEKLPHTKLEGDLFWDGDDQEDIGMIRVEDGKVWLCPAAIVYAIPGGSDAELIE